MDEAEAMVNRILRKASASRPAPSAARLNQPGAWDFFLSHGQAAAGDQVKMLCFMLLRVLFMLFRLMLLSLRFPRMMLFGLMTSSQRLMLG